MINDELFPFKKKIQAYLSEWRSVLWLTFGFSTAKTIIFTLWGSAKIQPWNTSGNNNELKATNNT